MLSVFRGIPDATGELHLADVNFLHRFWREAAKVTTSNRGSRESENDTEDTEFGRMAELADAQDLKSCDP